VGGTSGRTDQSVGRRRGSPRRGRSRISQGGKHRADRGLGQEIRASVCPSKRQCLHGPAASGGDFSDSPVIKTYPQRTTPKLDFLAAFEECAAKGGLKGGVHGPTTKRWRPKIVAFTDWLGHRDLAKATTDDGWMDHLIEKGFARKSIWVRWFDEILSALCAAVAGCFAGQDDESLGRGDPA
jgi:hypothetical protein